MRVFSFLVSFKPIATEYCQSSWKVPPPVTCQINCDIISGRCVTVQQAAYRAPQSGACVCVFECVYVIRFHFICYHFFPLFVFFFFFTSIHSLLSCSVFGWWNRPFRLCSRETINYTTLRANLIFMVVKIVKSNGKLGG